MGDVLIHQMNAGAPVNVPMIVRFFKMPRANEISSNYVVFLGSCRPLAVVPPAMTGHDVLTNNDSFSSQIIDDKSSSTRTTAASSSSQQHITNSSNAALTTQEASTRSSSIPPTSANPSSDIILSLPLPGQGSAMMFGTSYFFENGAFVLMMAWPHRLFFGKLDADFHLAVTQIICLQYDPENGCFNGDGTAFAFRSLQGLFPETWIAFVVVAINR